MEKKEGFNPSKYATEYIKKHYKRKEIKLKPEEAEQLEAVLTNKNEDLKSYTMRHIKKDYNKIKESTEK